jgi:hypothetical protein
MRILTSLLVMVFFLGGSAIADDSACDDLTGGALGLCTAYCDSMKCGTSKQNAADAACEAVRANYIKKTGAPPPCDAQPPYCPCFGVQDLIQAFADLPWYCGGDAASGAWVYQVSAPIASDDWQIAYIGVTSASPTGAECYIGRWSDNHSSATPINMADAYSCLGVVTIFCEFN